MTNYFVFDTDAEAQAAMAQIDAPNAMNFVNPETTTSTWAQIKHRATDGKPVFIAPPLRFRGVVSPRLDGTQTYVIEQGQDDWFPPEPMTP